MPAPVTYNRSVDKNQILYFNLKLRQGNDFLDISTWSFNFTLTAKNGAVIWNIANGSFTRPDIYTASFEKSIAEVGAVADGNYTISLLVTNTQMTSNEYMIGTWEFKS
jgi:hypothetical protein